MRQASMTAVSPFKTAPVLGGWKALGISVDYFLQRYNRGVRFHGIKVRFLILILWTLSNRAPHCLPMVRRNTEVVHHATMGKKEAGVNYPQVNLVNRSSKQTEARQRYERQSWQKKIVSFSSSTNMKQNYARRRPRTNTEQTR